ncbi:MAG: Transcriptional regulator [Rickettsiales bacterium]|jgi:TetR/AcrR family transcriptional repressor of nem operon|nr:Transcriptional regulator [Rickettsiales bacterium]
MQKNTRDAILDSTIELLWQQSYGSVSVDHICKAAQIHKGSFYHYFPTKVDVVIEAFERLWQTGKPLLDKVFSDTLSPLERLDAYCEMLYLKQKERAEQLGKVLGCPYVTCGSELSTLEERVRHKMDEIFCRSAAYFEALLKDAYADGLISKNDPAMAAQLLSYVAGVMYQAKLRNDVEIIRRDLKPGLLHYFDRVPVLKMNELQGGNYATVD